MRDERGEWQRLSAGVYADAEGGLHIFPEELLRARGFAVTEANVEMIEAAARDLVRATPGAELTTIEED